MKTTRLALIGAGNMARSLVGGLIADGWDPGRISISDPDPEQLAVLNSRFSVRTDTSNTAVTADSEVVVLAVKPQTIQEVARELTGSVQRQSPLVISIAAGVRAADLQRWLGGKCALVRCMPNTPALIQSGATALFASDSVSADQKDLAETILRAVGLVLWIDNEDLMDAVTALSGSGPAYFLLVIEALQQAGEALGLNHKTAHLLALQTAFGAAKMALESSEDVAVLRKQVTSPGGTTERALAVLEDGGLRTLFHNALTAARDRSRELAEQIGVT
ncbi:MAG: pyrroline-5-carboxylate reductase [Gammaproteobacteria bacterium]